MKKILAIGLFLIFLSPMKANAFDWGNFFRWFFFGRDVVTVTTADINETLNTIDENSKSIDESVQASFLNVVPLLTKQSDADNYAAQIKKINESKIVQIEKDNKILNIISDYSDIIKDNKLAVVLIIKTLSDKDKDLLIKNIKTLSENAQCYRDLYKKGANLITNVSTSEDNEQKSIVVNLTATTNLVKTKADTIDAFANQVSALAALAGVK